MPARPPVALAAALAAALLTTPASAQVLLELTDAPRPGFPATWEVTELAAHANVTGQSASVRLSQTFKNVGSQPLEARLLFPVPPDAAVRELTLLVDGKELVGTLQKAGEARATYEAIVRRNRDPALLEYAGYGLYRTSVFPIPAGASRTVQLRYTQLLGTSEGLIDLTIPVGSAGTNGLPTRKVEVTAAIAAEAPLKVVYSPTHPVEVERPTDRTATAKLTLENVVGRQTVRLLFGTADGLVGLNLLAYRDDASPGGDGEAKADDDRDGYFLLLAAPEVPAPDEAPPARTLVLVVDTSGSMSGEKMTQARNAAAFVVSRLRAEDTFNVVAYDSVVKAFRPELQKGDADGRAAGLAFVDGLRAGGGTNVNDALVTALDMLPSANDRPTYVVFLTDGQPTSGVTDEATIARNAAAANGAGDGDVKARVFSFGVGYDVNARLLDRLADGGRGVSAYVAPEEDVEAAVSELYGKIAAPVLTDLALDFAFAGDAPRAALNRVLPADLPDLFGGQQLTVLGRYAPGSEDLEGTFTLTGTRAGGDGERLSFDLPATLPSDSGRTAEFLPALWATRRIGELIDRLDLEGQNPELVEELVRLSIEHGILTPYTAFLAEEDVRLGDVAGNNAAAGGNLRDGLAATSGAFGVGQRALKGRFKSSGQAAGGGWFGDSGGFGGGGGGLGGGGGFGTSGGPAPPANSSRLFGLWGADGGRIDSPNGVGRGYEGEGRSPADRVRRVAGRSLFFKNGRWEQADLTPEQTEKPTAVEQFTDAWFALAKAAGDRLAPLLALAEPALVRIGGTTYLVTPPAAEEPAG